MTSGGGGAGGTGHPARILYGRRRGPKLRPHRQALMETLLPALAVPLPEDPGGAGAAGGCGIEAPLALFPPGARRALWLEIGFGGGEHLAAQAAAHPDSAFIGCEPFVNGVAKLLSRIEAGRLTNIRLHTDDARDLVRALPEASVERVHVLFPDPWPKTRHHRRRLISEGVLDDLARVLADGGRLDLATDHRGYARWMLARLIPHPAFAWTARGPEDWSQPPPGWVGTRYEAKALVAGRAPIYLVFRRRRRAAALKPGGV